MIKLVLDIGNTRLKAAFWNDKKMIRKYDQAALKEISHQDVLRRFGTPEAILVSSVVSQNTAIKSYFKGVRNTFFLNYKMPVPVTIKYKTPGTLGNDRLANAVAAHALFPDQAVLVIDAGTCLKYDVVDARANYLGGSIAPGLRMRFDALSHFTARLPKLTYSPKFGLVGQSTRESIISGVQTGILAETNGMIELYQKRFRNLKVILTGGDFRFFEGKLKKPIFVAPNLTLMGLNEILDYNIHRSFEKV